MSLFTQPIQDHLTSSPVDALARKTHPGMAHFAGTGPAMTTCRQCIFWDGCGDMGAQRFAKRGMGGGGLKPRACAKYRSMLNGEIGPRVPPDASACKYFEENPKAPPMFERG